MGRGKRQQFASSSSVAKALLPKEEQAYYGDLEKKHFSEEALGSRFLGTSLETLLESNPGFLRETDDREKFLDLGVPEAALLPGRSYFLFRAPGEEGMIAADQLSPDEEIHISRAKVGSLSFSVRGQRQKTEIGTAIIGDYPRDPSRRALITIFPGLPSEPDRSSISEENDLGLRSGDTLSLADLQKLLGREDLLLQIS